MKLSWQLGTIWKIDIDKYCLFFSLEMFRTVNVKHFLFEFAPEDSASVLVAGAGNSLTTKSELKEIYLVEY